MLNKSAKIKHKIFKDKQSLCNAFFFIVYWFSAFNGRNFDIVRDRLSLWHYTIGVYPQNICTIYQL